MSHVHEMDTPRNRGDHDAPHMSPVTPSEDIRSIMINNISWGAVLAGVALALVTQVILNLIGIGIGAATLDPGTGDNPAASTFSIGAGIWFVLSGVLAALAGGYAAGRLAGKPKESTSAWHGLITWAVSTAIIFYLLGSAAGSLLGGAYSTFTNVAGSAVNTAAQTVAPNLQSAADPFASIEQAIRGGTGGTDPEALRNAAVAAVRTALTSDPQEAERAREDAAQALARAQNIPIEQARTQVTQYEQQYRETTGQISQQATEAADTATTAVSSGALLGALGLILGAVAGWFGGRMGTTEPTVTASGVMTYGTSRSYDDDHDMTDRRSTLTRSNPATSATQTGNRQRTGTSRT